MKEAAPRFLITLAAITGLYFVAGKIGLSLAFVNASTSAVWPPAGIAVAALLIFGPRVWPAIAVGAFLVNVTTSGHVAASAAIAAGNTLEGLVAVWLVVRFARGRAAFERTGDLLRFTALAALGATTIAATIGTLTLLAFGLAARSDAGSIWLTWWLGDAVGTVVIGPLLVLWWAPMRWRFRAGRALEAAALAAAMAGVAILIFYGSPAGARRLPIQFMEIPVLLWAAFRFGPRATALVAAVLSVFAIRGTLDGFGPFVRVSPNESLLLLQGFVGMMTVVMLSVAAEITARRTTEAEMRALNLALEARVSARTEELSRLHDRLLEAQQVAHVGSWEWDVARNTLWWSEEMCRIYGMPEGAPPTYEEYLARVHPAERAVVDGAVGQAMTDGQPFTFDHRIIRPDGTVRTLHARGRVVTGPDGRVVRMMGTGHDVTEHRAAEEQRAQLMVEQTARRDAEEASRAKDQFLATLSHELRTPLNVAHGWAHILQSHGVGGERNTRAVDTICRNLDMLTRLVSDIIDVSRITAGAFNLDARPVDVAGVVEAAMDTSRQAAQARGLTLDARIAPSLPPVNGDARRLQQVVVNLLSNAVKFARPQGRVTLTVAENAGDVTIVVEDDGPGIETEFLPYVFDEFRQADSSTTREHGGLGLGLSIAKHLTNLHGGTITAANREGGGAVFTVRLKAGTTYASRSA